MKPTPDAIQPHPGIEIGDSIYFHHPHRGPWSAKVLASGKHGVTATCPMGDFYRVRWEHILGVKERVPRRFDVVENGEDGMIVSDGDGVRRYVATQNVREEEEGIDPPLAKARYGEAQTLRIAHEPGYRMVPVYDRRGFVSRRWKRTDDSGDFPGFPKIGRAGLRYLFFAHRSMKELAGKLHVRADQPPLHSPHVPGKPTQTYSSTVAPEPEPGFTPSSPSSIMPGNKRR